MSQEVRHGAPSPSRGTQAVDKFLGSDRPQFTVRAVVAGTVIGAVLCFANMYFGLQTGWVSMMSLQSTVVGFGFFHTLRRQFPDFTPLENVVLQTTAVSCATMPLAAGFVGIIPALGMLTTDERPGGPLTLSFGQLCAWSLAVAFFGVFFAVPLRKQTIVREKLRFPSGTATAEMIRVLHSSAGVRERPMPQGFRSLTDTGSGGAGAGAGLGVGVGVGVDTTAGASASAIASAGASSACAPASAPTSSTDSGARTVSLDSVRLSDSAEVAPAHPSRGRTDSSSGSSDVESTSDAAAAFQHRGAAVGDSEVPDDTATVGGGDWSTNWRLLKWTFLASAMYTLLTHFVPVMHNLPVLTWLGAGAATAYGWVFTPSLSYVGQGMIMGPRVGVSMMFGALLGYAVLAPVARHAGWAPGPINDGVTGAKAWVVWVSLAVMMGDSLMSLACLMWNSGRNYLRWRRQAKVDAATAGSGAPPPVSRHGLHSEGVFRDGRWLLVTMLMWVFILSSAPPSPFQHCWLPPQKTKTRRHQTNSCRLKCGEVAWRCPAPCVSASCHPCLTCRFTSRWSRWC